MALDPLAPNGCAPTPTGGRKDLLSPSDRVEPTPPNDRDARKPPKGGASAVDGTRPNNLRSISILVSASRLSDCPTGAPFTIGSTPSSAGWAVPKRGPLNGRAPMAPGPLLPNGCEPMPTSGRKVGSTPSRAGLTPPKRGWKPAVDDRPPSSGALVPSGQGRPRSSCGRAPSIPGRCHFCGSGGARGPSTRDGPVQRPRKAGSTFAAGVPLPNRALTAALR